MVLSASSVESYAADGSSYSVFVKQLMFCALGLVLFWAGLRIPPQKLRMLAAPMLLLGIVLLVAVLIPGLGALRGGSRAWFAFGPFSLQPSEGVKVALTLWGAHVLALRRNVLHRWKHALSPVVPVSLLIFVLLILQPDLGMTVSMGMVLIALLFFAGAPMRLMAALTVGGLAGAVILGLTAGYRQARIAAFLSPATADPLGPGYQATQALYSLADGGLFGVGLGQGRAKWSYLPNAHNDFIFAIIGEELGFLGAFAVLALFATLAYTGLRIAARTVDPWLRIVVATSTTWLVAQAAINIGYVVGLLPVTGLQLPLISSGGTSLVVTMFIFGVLANAARHEPEAVATLTRGAAARQRDRPCPADPAAPALPGSRARARRPARGGSDDRVDDLSVVVAGGGTAGHIEPAMALADAVRRLRPDAVVTALGTEKGLDTRLIPARGYPLELIPPVPLPRKPSGDLLRLPMKVWSAVSAVREVLRRVDADVVVGFGGYVALPAYLAARGRTPIVVHEANARAGLANKVGARFAARVAAAVPGSGLPHAEVLGIPLRRSVTSLDREALRPAARERFGLPADGPVLLVFGGSQGARSLNSAVAAALPGLVEAGIGVLHAHGAAGTPADPAPGVRASACPTSRTCTWPTPPPTRCCAGRGR